VGKVVKHNYIIIIM